MADGAPRNRILMTTDAVGGVWTYSLDLAREIARADIEVILAVMGSPPRASAAEAARSISGLTLLNTGLPLDWTAGSRDELRIAARCLADLAREAGASLVQLHTPALAAFGGFDVPVLSVHHSCLATWWQAVRPGEELPGDFAWRTELVEEGLNESDAVVAPSASFARAVADTYDLASLPLTVHNGRCAAEVAPREDAEPRSPFVLAAGRLWDEGKNFDALDRAALLLDTPILAAGPLHAPHGGSAGFENLRMLGPLGESDMRRWLSIAPVFVSAALYEPFGLSVLEAAQAGCALVLSDIPTFRELWSGAALFVPPHDDQAIARMLAMVIADEGLRPRLAARALHRAQRYTSVAMAQDMLTLYAGLLHGRCLTPEAAA